MSLTQISLSVLMLVAGVGIPVMAAWNAEFGTRIANPMGAVAVLCLVALGVSLLLLALTGAPKLSDFQTIPVTHFFAGALFILYMASITIAAPRIGLANAVFYVLIGQLVSAAIIDHFGWWGAIQSPITLRRVTGLIIIAAGIYLARKDVISALPNQS